MKPFNNRLDFGEIEVNIQIPPTQTDERIVLALVSVNENDFPLSHFEHGQWAYLQNFPTHDALQIK
jgi:hypothetical protein